MASAQQSFLLFLLILQTYKTYKSIVGDSYFNSPAAELAGATATGSTATTVVSS